MSRSGPPVDGAKDPWPRALSLPRAVCWRPRFAGTRQYRWLRHFNFFVFSNFMLGAPCYNASLAEYGWGLEGALEAVPPGFTYETSVFYGPGIREVHTIIILNAYHNFLPPPSESDACPIHIHDFLSES